MRTLTPVGAVATVQPVAAVDLETALWSPSLLDARGQERHDRLKRPESRAAFLAARAAAALCVAALLDVAPQAPVRFVQSCPECQRSGHGRPKVVGVPGLHVSWSHSRGHVAAVAAWRPCGIDVEEVRLLPVPERAFSGRELEWMAARKEPARASLRLWTRKEALVKAGALTLSQLGTSDLMAEDGLAPAASHGTFMLREHGVGDGLGSAVVALALGVEDENGQPRSDISWL